MLRRLYLAAAGATLLGLAGTLCLPDLRAQDAKPADAVKPAPSRITAVTVYQNTALVTREVTVPEAAGPAEVVVSPLPPATLESSLYAEGTADIRVLSARYRSRAIAEDNREEVRKLEADIKAVQKAIQEHESDLKTVAANTAFLAKLEGFTAATMTTLTEKGQLDAEKTIKLADHVREQRAKNAKEEVRLKQLDQEAKEKLAFLQRQLQEKAGGVSRTERDAVIVIDKKAGAGTVKLNYLVSSATWRPQYKLRASSKANDPVTVEYLASVTQQTGEDWAGVNLVLSTAQPLLNAAPPDLRALEIGVGGGSGLAFASPTGQPGSGGPGGLPPGGPGVGGGGGGGFGGMPSQSAYLKDLEKKSSDLRRQAVDNLNALNPAEQGGGRGGQQAQGGKQVNDAAALEQYRDLLVSKEELAKDAPLAGGLLGDGPSVTYRLKTKLSLPSRNDDQTLEIAKLELAPKFYHKAVPVLTPHVYRLADLTNTT
ncbi:MAG: mucoidy inhibitor MuiA family protein, partial [Gemmataceae bacterium]